MKIKILLADDHKILRNGMRSMIEKEPDLEVVGEAENGITAVQMACDLNPDVVIMDIAMPGINGVDATREILSKAPEIKVLALSTYSEKQFIFTMLKAGALGYLVKDCAFEELVSAVRSVAENKIYIAPKVLNIVVKEYLNNKSQELPKDDVQLTPRERDVLRLITKGKNTKEIASELYVSVKTIETHRQNIMNKLGIHNVAELTLYAVQIGLIILDTL